MLTIRSTIILPKSTNDGTPVDIMPYLSRIASQFGGYTSEATEGGWIMSISKELAHESNVTVYVDSPLRQIVNTYRFFVELAKTIKVDCLQESVYLNFGGIVTLFV